MKDHVRQTILELVKQKKVMQELGEDDNYFDLGVSSLSIIELQIGVEEALGVTILTSELMRLSTIRGWIDAYGAALRQRSQSRGQVATESLVGETQS